MQVQIAGKSERRIVLHAGLAPFDGPDVFDPPWLNATKTTMDGVPKALHEDPHMLDGTETGFLVDTSKQLILVDAGASGTNWHAVGVDNAGQTGQWAGSRSNSGRPAMKRMHENFPRISSVLFRVWLRWHTPLMTPTWW